jgi:hypothetical protein
MELDDDDIEEILKDKEIYIREKQIHIGPGSSPADIEKFHKLCEKKITRSSRDVDFNKKMMFWEERLALGQPLRSEKERLTLSYYFQIFITNNTEMIKKYCPILLWIYKTPSEIRPRTREEYENMREQFSKERNSHFKDRSDLLTSRLDENWALRRLEDYSQLKDVNKQQFIQIMDLLEPYLQVDWKEDKVFMRFKSNNQDWFNRLVPVAQLKDHDDLEANFMTRPRHTELKDQMTKSPYLKKYAEKLLGELEENWKNRLTWGGKSKRRKTKSKKRRTRRR